METWASLIRCLAVILGRARADPCSLGQDRPYRGPALGERATSFLHPRPFGQVLHQWQCILVHLLLLLRGARASVACCKAERSSSPGPLPTSHEGRFDLDAQLRLYAANHGPFQTHLLLSTLSNALSHHRLPHQAGQQRVLLCLARNFTEHASEARLTSLQFQLEFDLFAPNLDRYHPACHEPSVCRPTFRAC